ncbi:DUF2382 domain-containing protein [Streptacidiphilus cavernicola]|uniref:DUF2382 domain-containing protein n=1 Tax=Streptacidiphilus cavernicola TaxID=3342716 RepID=A0ABV6VPT8_9ACTN
MATVIDPTQVIGHKVIDAQGHKIGQAEEVYLDDSTGAPQWVTVKGGLFGGKEHFAPLEGASIVEDDVRLTCDKAQVDSAPDLETGHHLSVEEERALYQHYGLGQSGSGFGTGGLAAPAPTTSGFGTGGLAAPAAGAAGLGAAAGAATVKTPGLKADTRDEDLLRHDRDENTMTRYEERMRVGTERVESGHARLHKYVTTEQVQQVVPLTHQEVRIEREMIPEAERRAAMGDGRIGELEQDVAFFEERTVVTKETVPVERVHVHLEEVTEEVTVMEELRTEHIDLEGETRPLGDKTKGGIKDTLKDKMNRDDRNLR